MGRRILSELVFVLRQSHAITAKTSRPEVKKNPPKRANIRCELPSVASQIMDTLSLEPS